MCLRSPKYIIIYYYKLYKLYHKLYALRHKLLHMYIYSKVYHYIITIRYRLLFRHGKHHTLTPSLLWFVPCQTSCMPMDYGEDNEETRVSLATQFACR